jgi:hypothetical protein
VIDNIVAKLGSEVVDWFECGLLQNKLKDCISTSLDGWLVIKWNDLSDVERLPDGESRLCGGKEKL